MTVTAPSALPTGEYETLEAAAPGASSAGGIKLIVGLLATLLLAYATDLVLHGPGGTYPGWLAGWGVDAFELAAGLLIVARGVLRPRDRRYALLLGGAACSWACGDFAMTAETLHGATPATISLANFLWAAFYPLAYVAVMVLLQRDVKKLSAANYLDGVVAALVTAAALVAFGFHAIAAASGQGTEGAGVNLVYPVGDLLLAGLTILGVLMLPAGRRGRWWLISLAGAINAAGDICALFNGLVATDVGWFLNTLAWPTSLLLISTAVWLRDPGVPVQENTASGFRIPAVASGLALCILFVGSLIHTTQVAIGFASATLLAAGIRFGLALRRLRQLTEERHLELESSAAAERDSKQALQTAVRRYAEFAARVAEGDLTASVAGEQQELQELSVSLNTMVRGLGEISSEIQAGVHEIGGSTAEILNVVSRHTDSASQQSAAIIQTSSTVNELRAAADVTARRAREVAERAGDSVRVSDQGTSAVAAIADAMQDIRARVEGIAQEILTLAQRAQQIGVITETVNELADRSNLLALNATIEAARAGEAGRGFAVVADQVRDLAEQSKQATSKVETILNEVREATAAAVAASEEGAQVVERGLQLTTDADAGIRSLTDIIRAASEAAEEIAASAHQQSLGMDEIAGAMTNIEDGTTQFLDGAHASQLAASGLNELAAKLAGLTERYRLA
ncbi:MAG TPA: methyl-accepting chemotaxis protein [Solirubrobacteraceae bacterium]|nr:methyl-accepting chemotaxis protein [Solirubrobacteraceae bacterium]